MSPELSLPVPVTLRSAVVVPGDCFGFLVVTLRDSRSGVGGSRAAGCSGWSPSRPPTGRIRRRRDARSMHERGKRPFPSSTGPLGRSCADEVPASAALTVPNERLTDRDGVRYNRLWGRGQVARRSRGDGCGTGRDEGEWSAQRAPEAREGTGCARQYGGRRSVSGYPGLWFVSVLSA
jgi:hypothetical protein